VTGVVDMEANCPIYKYYFPTLMQRLAFSLDSVIVFAFVLLVPTWQ